MGTRKHQANRRRKMRRGGVQQPQYHYSRRPGYGNPHGMTPGEESSDTFATGCCIFTLLIAAGVLIGFYYLLRYLNHLSGGG